MLEDKKPEEDPKTLNAKEKRAKRILWIVSIASSALVITLMGVFLIGSRLSNNKEITENSEGEPEEPAQQALIPEDILNNKFGWLTGGPEGGDIIKQAGGLWARPHLGPFSWDSMQEKSTSDIDFGMTDDLVKSQQENGYGTLVTIWPFAEWDQTNRENADGCKVSEDDEFLPVDNVDDPNMAYLPIHRCNPVDWDAYDRWVTAIVERYDGDGDNDMPGLEIPIKYWEVMNEPDLSWNSDIPDSRLSFYRQNPEDYSELLVRTSSAIKTADEGSKVLIAGAAGGDDRFLNFYDRVFQDEDSVKAFDIGNVHCISNDQDTNDFNVGKYKTLLTKYSIDKPIWVTEAQAIYAESIESNKETMLRSTKGALSAGASRIFYTTFNLENIKEQNIPKEDKADKSKDTADKESKDEKPSMEESLNAFIEIIKNSSN